MSRLECLQSESDFLNVYPLRCKSACMYMLYMLEKQQHLLLFITIFLFFFFLQVPSRPAFQNNQTHLIHF